ncbi:MAG: PPC domain-containing DNA-binding protein [Candidatus Brocadiia bacterium]
MKYKKINDKWFIILAKGEKVVEKLTEFCNKKDIKAGFFKAIGAINDVEMAHFDPLEKKYSYKKMSGALEIVSLMGNVTRKDNQIIIHSHISVSAENMLVYGGHLKEAIVSVTCEIALVDLKTTVVRTLDKDSGLNLVDFS